MKIWTAEHVFDHPWDTVVKAAWRKYPNPMNPAVKSSDVTERRVDEDGVLRSRRVLSTEWYIPAWVSRLIGLENPSFAYEYSEVDPARKEMLLKSVNLNCIDFVSIDETLVYKPHPADPQKTLLEQSTIIRVRGVPLVNYCEGLITSSINSNAHKGRQAMEWVIGNIKQEYEELTHKLSSDYLELSQKLSSEYQELSNNVLHGIDEIRRGLDSTEQPQ